MEFIGLVYETATPYAGMGIPPTKNGADSHNAGIARHLGKLQLCCTSVQ